MSEPVRYLRSVSYTTSYNKLYIALNLKPVSVILNRNFYKVKEPFQILLWISVSAGWASM